MKTLECQKSIVVFCLLLVLPGAGLARQHLWDVAEVYSNADGSIQYIEIFTTSGFQDVLSLHQIIAFSEAVPMSFSIPSNLPDTNTANRSLLFATPGFAAIPGAVTPDYSLPTAPFFDPGSNNVSIVFATPGGVAIDTLVFFAGELPADGVRSLNADRTTGTNTPTNYAGQSGQLELVFEAGFESP